MIYLQLFWEFLKIGLFAVGGGMATLPFLERLAEKTGWYSSSLITDMIAVSESTPGPIGINMATYVGCTVAGFLGGIVATLGVVMPAIVVVTIVSKSLARFRGNHILDDAFYGLRPAVTGLIAAAGINVFKRSVLCFDLFQSSGVLRDLFDLKKLAFFLLVFFAIKKFKLHPVIYIFAAAAVGILLSF